MGKISKKQKYEIFAGYKAKNQLYVKMFNKAITLIQLNA